MSTLLYLASGQYLRRYEDLPFDQVILVNRVFHQQLENRPFRSKVRLIEDDALDAIKTLKQENQHKIDCLVSVNEGLIGGGGDYPIFNEQLLGYLHPLFADELLVITSIDYYNAVHMGKRVARMDWGFTAERLIANHEKYVQPIVFTRYENPHPENYGDVFYLRRNRTVTPPPLNQKLEISIIHGSIWEAETTLDSIGLNLRPTDHYGREKINTFFLGLSKVCNIHSKSIKEIIFYAEAQKIKHLGLTPWMDGDYQPVIEFLQKYQPQHLKKITFYHLRRKDYGLLYEFSRLHRD